VPKVSTIAIDGPAASGKTVVGRQLALQLGFQFLDTGLMYRAITLAAIQHSTPLSNDVALTALASTTQIAVADTPQGTRVFLNNQDVTDSLRDPEVEAAVSLVSAIAGVRAVLVAKQRAMAEDGAIIMAGRDIGTVVLADADVKIYLQASAEERAKRRQREQPGAKDKPSVGAVQTNLEARDLQDSQRAASPLRPAEDAHIIMTDGLSIEQVVAEILKLVTARS
jgi:cytidylate kinase